MNNKHVIGVYDSSEELINDFPNAENIDNNLSVIGEDREAVWEASDELGIAMEPVDGGKEGIVESIMSALKGDKETPVTESLVQMGLSEEQAKEYAPQLENGKLLVVGDNGYETEPNNNSEYGYADSSPGNHDFNSNNEFEPENNLNNGYDNDTEKEIPLREEQLDVSKHEARAGDIEIEKRVVEDEETVNIPVSREEVYVKKRPVENDEVDSVNASALDEDEEYHIPVREEQVEVTKRPVVKDEVVVGKREVEDEEQVRENVKHEELHVKGEGNLDVDDDDNNVFDDSASAENQDSYDDDNNTFRDRTNSESRTRFDG
ncbi:YsnF/AvaK domain-containing protein [Pseudalkalibacillus caeni]|uniref:YsnF/AvaK domain-containing protein n=1 Tax=Exobacillus caeni TaxID=2574798 RepID=A0A5R9F3V0_9BACL|nr:YsnF/AvaK domain-containing protein [Pseudalkalibacillus caeni]TLS37016.1 YsnF/AvaK domain-containing protein [Pseudalkalibacillus caeni]